MFSNINVSQGYQAVSCNINILSSVPRIFEAVLRSAHSNDSISNNIQSVSSTSNKISYKKDARFKLNDKI